MTYVSFFDLVRIRFAGFPPTTVYGATFFVTTDPGHTTAPSQMVTPGMTIAAAKSTARSPMTTSLVVTAKPGESISCPAV